MAPFFTFPFDFGKSPEFARGISDRILPRANKDLSVGIESSAGSRGFRYMLCWSIADYTFVIYFFF